MSTASAMLNIHRSHFGSRYLIGSLRTAGLFFIHFESCWVSASQLQIGLASGLLTQNTTCIRSDYLNGSGWFAARFVSDSVHLPSLLFKKTSAFGTLQKNICLRSSSSFSSVHLGTPALAFDTARTCSIKKLATPKGLPKRSPTSVLTGPSDG